MSQSALTENFSAKSGNIYQQARLSTINLYAKCDSAFLNDSVLFRQVCEANDITNFLKITGITLDEIEENIHLTDSACEMFVKDYPEYAMELEGEPCKECVDNPLKKLYTATSQSQVHGGLAEVAASLDPGDIWDSFRACKKRCFVLKFIDKRAYWACVAACTIIDNI